MKPYYQDDAVTLYHADCRDILPTFGRFDLLLTDPPYNVGVDYGEHNDNMNEQEWDAWCRAWFVWCLENCDTVLVTGQKMLPYYARIRVWKWLLCWWKPGAMGRSPVGFCNWEPVGLWGKGGKDGCDMIKAPIIPDQSIDGHPCPKPLYWASGLLNLFPNAKTVLDPFAGSGTTGRACKDLGRKCVLIEREEKYCEIAAKRMQQEVLF